MELVSGEKLEIIDCGIHNLDSGPDFFNAKIKIDETIWAGNVEIHVNSSDWYKHNHDKDFSYHNVVLHIVFNYDKPIFLPGGTEIPTWEMQFPHVLYNKYSEFKINEKSIPCEDYFELVDSLKISMWLQNQAIERLEAKTINIQNYLDKTKNDWEHAFYIILARSFGFGINSMPFEQLASCTPLSVVRKCSSEIFKLEALFFGQAGLLKDAKVDDYLLKLSAEYEFLRKKHSISPIIGGWKTARMRPNNFPQVRIAQFASLMFNIQGLFSAIIEEDFINLQNYFKISPSEYWKTHYVFGKPVDKANTNFGDSAFNIIAINTLAPFIFYYFKNTNNGKSTDIVFDWLNKLKPEDNRDIRLWKALDIFPANAFESQALINLKKEYCDLKKCLDCTIGCEILKQINKI